MPHPLALASDLLPTNPAAMLSAYSYCTRVYGRTYRGGGGYGGGGGRGGGGGNSRRDDAEIEKLFESSRNATGINFDKYEEIPVGKHSFMSVFYRRGSSRGLRIVCLRIAGSSVDIFADEERGVAE